MRLRPSVAVQHVTYGGTISFGALWLLGQVRFGGGRIKLFVSILASAFLLNCSADLQANDFGFVEWTITSDFLPDGQRLTTEKCGMCRTN